MLTAITGVKPLSGIDISDRKAYFIVYFKDISLGVLELVKLKYVKQITLGEKGNLLNPLKNYEADIWVKDSTIKLRFAPIEGKQDMYRDKGVTH